jgi:hypothetical protein
MTDMRPDNATTRARVVRGAQAISLFVLVAVVVLRPLVSESYDSAGNSITRAIGSLADPAPARTLGFDLIILAASCLWLLSFALDRKARYQRTGLEIGLVLLAIAGGLSCFFAGNKRLAINGTVDWLCLPILTITLVQLLRTHWQRRLVLAAILATACVHAAQCYEQYFLGFAETIEQYEAGKEEFWAKQGVDLDSSTVDAFERRLRAREAGGFFAHSNVAGGYLMLCAFAAIGVISRSLAPAGPRNVATGGVRRGGRNPWKEGPLKKSTPEAVEEMHHEDISRNPYSTIARFASLVFALAIAGAVFLTGSMGAAVSGATGLALLVIACWKRDWIATHRRRAFWISCMAIIVGVAAVIGHGLYHDSLPGWSLTFRWQYWKASASMIADHFWTGVGRENFGRHYTLYKDIASPEEVSNPHNFFVQAAAEWGIVGFLGALAMLVGVTCRAARSSPEGPLQAQSEEAVKPIDNLTWGIGIGFVVVLGRALLLGSDDTHYVYYAATTTGIIWVPAFLAFFQFSAFRNGNQSDVLTPALAAGLFAFLLQDMISFALFIPASATTFFALLGIWLSGARGEKTPTAAPMSACSRFAVVAIATALTIGFVFFLLSPVVRAESQRELAEGILPDGNSILYFRKAQVADPLAPTYFVEEARFLASQDNTMVLKLALQALSHAQTRDPFNASLFQVESQIHARMAMLSGGSENYLGAVQAAKAALSLYPQDPAGLVSLADSERVAGQELQSRELLRAAVGHYQEALSLDEKRLEWETIQRFRPRVIDEIHANIRGIQLRLLEER